ncbi:MAG: hypothetical protein Q9215_004931 [Flavoplaca cf. flavocitrina]
MTSTLTKSNLDFIQISRILTPHFSHARPQQQYPKQWPNHLQIARGYLSMRIKDVGRMGEADVAGGDEEPAGDKKHTDDEETSGDEDQNGNSKIEGERKEHALAWTQVIKEMRDLDRKLSQCNVALEAAERYGLMGTRDKWGWERRHLAS